MQFCILFFDFFLTSYRFISTPFANSQRNATHLDAKNEIVMCLLAYLSKILYLCNVIERDKFRNSSC